MRWRVLVYSERYLLRIHTFFGIVNVMQAIWSLKFEYTTKSGGQLALASPPHILMDEYPLSNVNYTRGVSGSVDQ